MMSDLGIIQQYFLKILKSGVDNPKKLVPFQIVQQLGIDLQHS
jgi:hypothetical protein